MKVALAPSAPSEAAIATDRLLVLGVEKATKRNKQYSYVTAISVIAYTSNSPANHKRRVSDNEFSYSQIVYGNRLKSRTMVLSEANYYLLFILLFCMSYTETRLNFFLTQRLFVKHKSHKYDNKYNAL